MTSDAFKSTDLRRLRERCCCHTGMPVACVVCRAADELEQLRAWRARMIAIPSPSSVCGLLGCQNLNFHVHDIEQVDVESAKPPV